VRRPKYTYHSLVEHTKLAGGGAAGSAFGRMVRTMGGTRSPNVNRIELDYCAPVYARWMHSHPDDVSSAMWDYLERMKPLLPKARPWPKQIAVEMLQ
jgi:hypothetical protein